MAEPISFCKNVAKISTDFELQNTELKRQYIVSNIIIYNKIIGLIKESKGTFGTGYPFYALKPDLTGALPVIFEQIRYNDELYKYTDEAQESFKDWFCATCLEKKSITMQDLKAECKKCNNMSDMLKPRKLINRLPDLDLWTVCSPSDIEILSKHIEEALKLSGFRTSDVDPVKTIYELEEIVTSLKNNEMPKNKLPIDTHIIDNVTLYTLISQIPDAIDYIYRHNRDPKLDYHPLSLRKTWQKDDTAYSFIYDYLAAFVEFNFDDEIQNLLNETRREVARKYSLDQLYDFMLVCAGDSSKRRFKSPKLKKYFDEKVSEWREL